MGHEIGKVIPIELYLASDGTTFTGETEANNYETALDRARLESLYERAFSRALASASASFAEKNPYYGIFNGILFRGARGEEVLRSLIKDTPELTLSLIEQVENSLCDCFDRDGETVIDYAAKCCRKAETHLKTTGTYSFSMRQSPPEGQIGDLYSAPISMARQKTVDSTVAYALENFTGEEDGNLNGINLKNIRLTDDIRKENGAILSIGSPELGPLADVFRDGLKGDANWLAQNITGTLLNPDAKEGVNYDIRISYLSE